MNINLDPMVPEAIMQAALRVGSWMKAHGYETWELGDICSRNHAAMLRAKPRQEMRLVKAAIIELRDDLAAHLGAVKKWQPLGD